MTPDEAKLYGDLPTVSPAEAAIFYIISRLVAHLEQREVIDQNQFADVLEVRLESLPAQVQPLLINMIASMRPTETRLRGIPGGKPDEPQQD